MKTITYRIVISKKDGSSKSRKILEVFSYMQYNEYNSRFNTRNIIIKGEIQMKLKWSKFQMTIELITVILLILMWGYLIISWSDIPDKIPGHYNAAGIVDRWGNKNEILALPISSVLLYILLTVVSFFPLLWNVPVKITEENMDFVYSSSKNMLILLKLEVIICFTYIFYCNIKTHSLGIWFLPLWLAIIFGTIINYMIRVINYRKHM